MREKILWNPQIKKIIHTEEKKRCSQIRPQLKVEKEDGRKALKA